MTLVLMLWSLGCLYRGTSMLYNVAEITRVPPQAPPPPQEQTKLHRGTHINNSTVEKKKVAYFFLHCYLRLVTGYQSELVQYSDVQAFNHVTHVMLSFYWWSEIRFWRSEIKSLVTHWQCLSHKISDWYLRQGWQGLKLEMNTLMSHKQRWFVNS